MTAFYGVCSEPAFGWSFDKSLATNSFDVLSRPVEAALRVHGKQRQKQVISVMGQQQSKGNVLSGIGRVATSKVEARPYAGLRQLMQLVSGSKAQQRVATSGRSGAAVRAWQVLALAALTLIASLPAYAQLAQRHSFNVTGDVEMIGNGLLTCSGSNCTSDRNGTGGNGNRQMVFINTAPVGGSAPANSSTADLTLPVGANVLSAGLYWAGRAGNSSNSRRNIWFRTPGGSYQQVTAATSNLHTFNSQGDSNSDRPYTAYVDVTAQVRSAGSGTYAAGGMTAQTGNGGNLGNYGGWALIVLYEDSNKPMRRLMVFDGNAGYVGNGNPASVTVSGLLTPPSGSFNAYMGALVWEGDADITGDRFRLTGPGVLNGGDLSDTASPVGNFWNSRISRLGTLFTARNPNYPNNFAIDLKLVDISNVPANTGQPRMANNATTATLGFTSTQDAYFPHALVFVADLYRPNLLPTLKKSVANVSRPGATDVRPGEVLEYTINFGNTGRDGAIRVEVTDPIPAGTTYLPGSLVVHRDDGLGISTPATRTDAAGDDTAEYDAVNGQVVFRAGFGADAAEGGMLAQDQYVQLRFRVTMDADFAGDTLVNVVTATHGSQTFPNDPDQTVSGSANTQITVLPVPVVTVDKSADPANSGLVSIGDEITYTLTVTVGATATWSDVVLSDQLGAGLTFGSVTNAGSFIHDASNAPIHRFTLPAGTTSGTYNVTYTATVNQDAGNTVGNLVTATGGGDPDDPDAGDPTCSVCETGHDVSAPSMTVVKSAGAPSGHVVGATIDYSFLVTNTGNVTITGLVINDDQLTTLAPGETTTCTGTYVLTQADVNAGEVVNVATAEGTPPSTPSNPNPPPVETPPSTTTTTIDADPSITSSKLMSGNADEDGSGTVTVGDTLTYTVTATNTGNVTLTDVVVADSKIVPAAMTCDTLAPGAACVLTGTYVVTADDANAGMVHNTAVITDGSACPVDSTADACHPSIDVPVVVPEIVAEDDSGTTPQNTPVTTPVLGNDLLNGSPIEDPSDVVVSVVGQPEHGEVVVNPDGTITYTPAPGYSGTDTYQYEICEAANPSNCATATVTITILPNVVEAIDDEDSTEADTPVTIPVPSNDTSTGAPLDPGSVTQVTPPSNGSITVNPDGSIVYLPNPGFTGEDSFTYRICDTSVPTPVCDEATVTVTVTGEAALRLTKVANVNEVKIGDLVRYTLTVENVGVANITGASVVDTPPAGFSYVEGSLAVTDGDQAVSVHGQSPLRFDGLDIAAGQKATLVYLMRVGAGVRPGSHINQAQAWAADGETPLSNIATAEVALVADALFEDSLLLGTVFDDRDGDGWQDSATMDKVQVQGGFAASAYVAGSTTVDRGQGPVAEPDASSPMLHGIQLGSIDGRASQADPVEDHRVVISQRLSELSFTDDFVMTSKQGVTVRMDAAGVTRVEQHGDAARGLTAAAPEVERRVSRTADGYVVDYVITNTGIDERGIPGVRIASVEGLLIETDQFGRYHLAGIAGGDWARGRNFILKVDPSTLPPGTKFTTDNPLIRRITPGLPVRFDFGVQLPVEEISGGERAEMSMGELFFAPDSAQVREQYLPAIQAMADKLVEYDGGEVVISANGGEVLALERATAVKAALMGLLPAEVAGRTEVAVRADAADAGTRLVGLKGDETLLGTVLFDTDKSVVRPQFDALLTQVATTLEQRGGGVVVLTGHTDLRASVEYNTALGLRRATAVYEALAKHLSPQVRANVRVQSGDDAAAPARNKQ